MSFRKGAVVELSNAKNLPQYLNFSGCDKVNLFNVKFTNKAKICLQNVREVSFAMAQNLPHDLDFSQCDVVDLSGCNLSNRSDLRFKSGSFVNLNQTIITQPFLDLSDCAMVKLDAENKIYSEEILFRDYLQRDTLCHTWVGSNKLFYTCNMDDDEARVFKQNGGEKNKSFSNNVKRKFSQFVVSALFKNDR